MWQGRVVCSEMRNRPDGRRKYLACNDLRATARQIVTGYRMRWAVELFHKSVKQHLGFEDVATMDLTRDVNVHWCIVRTSCCTCHRPVSPGSQYRRQTESTPTKSADKEKRQIPPEVDANWWRATLQR